MIIYNLINMLFNLLDKLPSPRLPFNFSDVMGVPWRMGLYYFGDVSTVIIAFLVSLRLTLIAFNTFKFIYNKLPLYRNGVK